MATKKFGIVLDARKCLNCKACTVACKFENMIHPGDSEYRIWVSELELKGTYPNLSQEYQPSQCQHCENTPCASVCPTKATYKSPEGVVLIDYDKCILCKACMTACPYDARYENVHLHAIDKCTFCYQRQPEGREPACVETCPTRVRVFGDLNDPESEASKVLARNHSYQLKPEKNTRPRLHYIK
ncbi:MAG: 4Fe-4S dicluster domain-containing protein [Geovibrio sp.]|uniref:4Fe-4S dicluster domain-containing protein n=1 Tax=Geovibrio ferrireducens TaxID=46201 RepID=UPI002248031E|nr:4Fe-4S dicluster domain-containing protein [Geovibrio ferrireducens]MCD8490579.1 4Fe-4S dicluster domain-containing protein [Geovibrio sp.]